MCCSLFLTGDAQGETGLLPPTSQRSEAVREGWREREKPETEQCAPRTILKLSSLCLTLKTPKAKDPRLEGTETQGGRPELSLHRKWLGKNLGQSHFCVCFIGSKNPAGGSREEAWRVQSWVSPSGPAWGRGNVTRARARGAARPP